MTDRPHADTRLALLEASHREIKGEIKEIRVLLNRITWAIVTTALTFAGGVLLVAVQIGKDAL